VLDKIDGFLEKAGFDKTRLVSAQMWPRTLRATSQA
jgi:enamine deaminase RidA (YjgF/YER057c/UK114 family)